MKAGASRRFIGSSCCRAFTSRPPRTTGATPRLIHSIACSGARTSNGSNLKPCATSLLTIGGSLDNSLYGRPIDLERNPESTRRTIYGVVDRSDLLDAFVNFDFANPDMVSGKRYETSVPQQALFLMNSPVVVEQAKKLVALDSLRTAPTTRRALNSSRTDLSAPARPEEIQLGLDFITQTH